MDNQLQTQNLYSKIADLIEQSRKYVAKSINTAMAATYYEIGRFIVEDEQKGKARAEYGKQVLQDLSARLTEQFGKGWSVDNLKKIRQFYVVYSKMITSGYPIAERCFSRVDIT